MDSSEASVDFNFDSADFNMEVFDDMEFAGFTDTSETDADTYEKPVTKTSYSRSRRVIKSTPKGRGSKPSINVVLKELGLFVPKITAEPPYPEYDDAFFHHRFYSMLKPRVPTGISGSIVDFPKLLVNCINSGDNLGLVDLFHGGLQDDCELGIYCFDSSVSVRTFLRYFELTTMLQPDRILFINDTRVLGNQIIASSAIKFTACKMLFESICQTVEEPDLLPLFRSRVEHLTRRLNADASEEKRQQVLHLIESDADLVMYGSVHIQVTFDEVTNKVTGLYLAGGLTSAHIVCDEDA